MSTEPNAPKSKLICGLLETDIHEGDVASAELFIMSSYRNAAFARQEICQRNRSKAKLLPGQIHVQFLILIYFFHVLISHDILQFQQET